MITILNLSMPSNETGKFIRSNLNWCTTEEWDDALNGFDPKVRYEATNLAAHNWNVILFGDLLFIGGPNSGDFYTKDGKRISYNKEQKDQMFPMATSNSYGTMGCWENNKTVYRQSTLNFASFGEEGRRLAVMVTAVEKYASTITSSSIKWFRIGGEEFDAERSARRLKYLLQSFYDELRKI